MSTLNRIVDSYLHEDRYNPEDDKSMRRGKDQYEPEDEGYSWPELGYGALDDTDGYSDVPQGFFTKYLGDAPLAIADNGSNNWDKDIVRAIKYIDHVSTPISKSGPFTHYNFHYHDVVVYVKGTYKAIVTAQDSEFDVFDNTLIDME